MLFRFQLFSGNTLDSSGPTKRRGKEREKPRLKKPNKFKRLLIKDRKERQELRRLLAEISAAKLKQQQQQQQQNAESRNEVSLDVKVENKEEVEIKVEPEEEIESVQGI